MADKWYFAHGGTTYGPYSAGQLQEQAAAGKVQPLDTVWKEGLEKRALASKVRSLFAAAPFAPSAAAAEPTVALPALVAPAESAPPIAKVGDIADDAGSLPLQERSAPSPSPDAPAAPTKAEEAKREALARAADPRRQAPEPRQKRVLSTKGAILSSQDGAMMKFRKQCVQCNYSDTSMTTMPIPIGGARLNFYCPKCKKSRQVEIQGVG
jgi:hypothetical protein